MASSVGATAVSPLKSRDNNSLKLSNLPRYHPANFPTSGVAPAAPHAQHQQSPRHSSETQKRLLHLYQRDLINNAILAPRNPGGDHRPNSPQLAPLGSPGPVTPLVLEDEAVGYLASGPSSAGQSDRRNEQAALVDSLLHEESPRRRDSRGDGLAATDTRP
ncbi:MAG: hypothetical protein M1832_002338 [Thelocarpon impressellum]|nr:MAG: hypothetical protein M1832_002338 [Thelocarpon impressellum]